LESFDGFSFLDFFFFEVLVSEATGGFLFSSPFCSAVFLSAAKYQYQILVSLVKNKS
jgi:hypothetical protein